jgi:hypothetical protein
MPHIRNAGAENPRKNRREAALIDVPVTAGLEKGAALQVEPEARPRLGSIARRVGRRHCRGLLLFCACDDSQRGDELSFRRRTRGVLAEDRLVRNVDAVV